MFDSTRSKKEANPGKNSKKKKKTLFRISLEILLLVSAILLVSTSIDRSLSKIAIVQIERLTNTKISADSIKFKPDGTVAIKQLVIKSVGATAYDEAILKAKTVRAHFNFGSILLFRPRLKRIIINEFVFNIIYDTEKGQWNLSGLKIAGRKAGSGNIPTIFLNRGTLHYSKISSKQKETVAEIACNIKLQSPLTNNIADKQELKTQEKKNQPVCSFELHTGQWAKFGQGSLSGIWQPGKIEINGRIERSSPKGVADVLTADTLSAVFNYESNKDYSLKLYVADLKSEKKSVDEHFAILRSLFPEKLSSFETLQKVFDRFRPRGLIDLYIEFGGNLARLNESKLTGKVHCKDVRICDRRFEYPIEKLNGFIDITERSAVLNNLQGYHGDVELYFNGWTRYTKDKKEHQFQITSDNMLLDDDLYKALSPRRQRLWDDFSPEGIVSINQNINKSTTTSSKVLSINLLNCQARWRHFPYPLQNLRGTLLFDSNGLTFTDVVSQSDEEKITINGKVSSYGSANPLYDIEIAADKIDSTFIRSEEYSKHTAALLPKHFLKTIKGLESTGNVNFKAHLNNLKAKDSVDYNITIDCLGNGIDSAKFSYPLRDVTGVIKINNEGIKLENISGTVADNIQITPEGSTIKIDGEIKTADNTFGGALLNVEANDINLDERLGLALPGNIKNTYFNTSPTGRFDLDFKNIRIFTAADGAKYIDLFGTIRFKGCNLNISPTITELNGVLKIDGLYKSGQGFCEGQAELDSCSARIKDKLLTELTVDMLYDNELRQWQSTKLTASCYEGMVAGRFELQHKEKGRADYVLDVGFYDIDLKQFLSDPYHYEQEAAVASETKANNNHNGYSRGNMDGSLSISGRVGGENERIGRCRLEIADMQVGKLSPLAKLLYILKLTEPKDFAFEQMVVDSYVKNNNLFLKKIDISGEAIAFNGLGHLDLENLDIDLILTARGQRLTGTRPGVLQSLTEGLGQGIVHMNVTGNVHNPKIITETLPIIKGMLHLLGTKESERH